MSRGLTAVALLLLGGCADTTSNVSFHVPERDPSRSIRVHDAECGTVTEVPMRRRIDDVRGDDMPLVGALGLGVLSASLAAAGVGLAVMSCPNCKSSEDQIAVRGGSVMLLGAATVPLAAIAYMGMFFHDRHRYEAAPAVRRCVREPRTAR